MHLSKPVSRIAEVCDVLSMHFRLALIAVFEGIVCRKVQQGKVNFRTV